MLRRTKLLMLAALVAAQLMIVAAPAAASGPLDKVLDKLGADDEFCLVWIWIDGWRCAVP
jgi:hypothetical protein